MHVFLIHGMGRTSASMWILARRLEAAGHRTSRFGYLVTVEGFEHIARRFARYVEKTLEKFRSENPESEPPPYAVVGHSLGNLLTRQASPMLPPGFHRFVMLAPPNRPPVLARRLSDNPVFRWITGDTGRKLTDEDFFDRLPIPDVPSLIISGNRGPRARWLPFGDRPNDAILGVEETRLAGIPSLEVPGLHTFLMNRDDVFAAIRDFLDASASPWSPSPDSSAPGNEVGSGRVPPSPTVTSQG